MRSEEINKWIDEGGSLPEELTQEEHKYLSRLGWMTMAMEYDNGQKEFEWHFLHGKKHGKYEAWYDNGQKEYEYHYFHGMKHGVFKEWDEDGDPLIDEEYYYGNKIKETS
jgi:hypothetical protein